MPRRGIDANADVTARWQWVRSFLAARQYVGVPVEPDPDGTVVSGERCPKIGIWIMPDNRSAGILEDFVTALVPAGDPLLAHARQSVGTIPGGHRRFRDQHTAKAVVHTWLAWQEEPGVPMGAAIMRRYLASDGPEALRFITWLRRLFDLPTS